MVKGSLRSSLVDFGHKTPANRKENVEEEEGNRVKGKGKDWKPVALPEDFNPFNNRNGNDRGGEGKLVASEGGYEENAAYGYRGKYVVEGRSVCKDLVP